MDLACGFWRDYAVSDHLADPRDGQCDGAGLVLDWRCGAGPDCIDADAGERTCADGAYARVGSFFVELIVQNEMACFA